MLVDKMNLAKESLWMQGTFSVYLLSFNARLARGSRHLEGPSITAALQEEHIQSLQYRSNAATSILNRAGLLFTNLGYKNETRQGRRSGRIGWEETKRKIKFI